MDYSTKGYHGTLADTAKSVIEENGFRVSSKETLINKPIELRG